MSGWRIKVRTPDDPGDWTARGEGPIGTPYQYISGDVAVRLDFDEADTLREDWGHGWTFMGVSRLLHVLDERRWRAIAEKGTDIRYGYGSDAVSALADLREAMG